MNEYYIGLMSGTSMDGIDAALVEFNNNTISLVDSHQHAIPAALKTTLQQLSLDTKHVTLDMLGEADSHLGLVFSDAVKALLKKTNFKASQITAIGSHGQTIRHRPDLKHNFSMQIGDANRISFLTGITTVADFRRKDMAAGGEGAPLAPAFHQQVFQSENENIAVLNIGGIANISYLPKNKSQACFGFDTGPANGLMDAWIQKHHNKPYDKNGAWAANFKADENLVPALMQDKFISLPPPKSAGREHYNLEWLMQILTSFPELNEGTVQASLCEFTCESIAHAINQHLPDISTLIVCGGGVHNSSLMNQLSEKLSQCDVISSESKGVPPDWVEAIAFAWLAKQTIENKPGNLPAVTGAKQAVTLGAVYYAG